MKNRLLALAVLSAMAAAPASAGVFTVDFEKTWDYVNGGVNDYYNGGAAADGSTGGPNLGVSFVGVSGLSNAGGFTYYANAPSMVGVAYAYTDSLGSAAVMNVAAGVDGFLSFYYSSPVAATGAVLAYSGLNGTGSLLGSLDLAANSSVAYDTWTKVHFSFSGTAHSFDLTNSADAVAFDNISSVPELDAAGFTGAVALLGGVMGLAAERRRRAVK